MAIVIEDLFLYGKFYSFKNVDWIAWLEEHHFFNPRNPFPEDDIAA